MIEGDFQNSPSMIARSSEHVLQTKIGLADKEALGDMNYGKNRKSPTGLQWKVIVLVVQ